MFPTLSLKSLIIYVTVDGGLSFLFIDNGPHVHSVCVQSDAKNVPAYPCLVIRAPNLDTPEPCSSNFAVAQLFCGPT